MQLRNPSAVFQSASLFVAEAGVVGGMSSGLLTCDSASSLDSYPLAAADFVCGREHLVTASWDRLGHLYDLNTGQEVQSLAGHDRELTDVRSCWDSNLPVVVTSARDSTFRVWDFRQPRLEVHVQQAHSRSVFLHSSFVTLSKCNSGFDSRAWLLLNFVTKLDYNTFMTI